MPDQLKSWDPIIQDSVARWKRSHRRIVVILGALYLLTLALAVYDVDWGWPKAAWTHRQMSHILTSSWVLLIPVGIFFFPYLFLYRRGLRILALGQLVPALFLGERLQMSVYTYEFEGKTFKTMRYLSRHPQAERYAVPVAFVDPESPTWGVILLVGGQRN